MKKIILSLMFGLGLVLNLSFAQPNLETLEDAYEDQIEAMGLSEAEEDRLEAQMEQALYGTAMSEDFENGKLTFGHCQINGKEVPCEEFFSEAAKIMQTIPFVKDFLANPEGSINMLIWIAVWMMVIGFLFFVFWIRMLIDVINHQKDSKELWIMALVLGSLLAAIIYYFTARKTRKQAEKANLQNQ